VGSAAAGERRAEQLRLQPIAAGFAFPTHAAAAPGEPGKLYVAERAGRVLVLDLQTGRRRVFLDLRRVVAIGGLRGFFSLAFHPRYRRNHRLFVAYSGRDRHLHVAEYRRTRRTAVLRVPVRSGQYRHYGGQLAFGPDGALYVSVGDGMVVGAKADSPAQDLTSTLGKLLRVDVDSPRAEPHVVAYGLRNPWRFSFDRATQDLYVADVGAERWEEVNVLPSRRRELANFGWDVYEGAQRVKTTPVDPTGRLVFPVISYRRQRPHCAVIGGHVYRGRSLDGVRGRYFYGDLCSARIWSFRLRRGRAVDRRREPFDSPGALNSFAEDAAGELYVLSGGFRNGTVSRLVSAAGSGSR
jgi:glucose/arabinose dehydrogenase